VKFGWTSDYDKSFHNALLGSVLILGMTFGSFGGGIIMNYGRRRTIILSLYIGLFGNIITYNLNFFVLLIGRFMFGMSTGIFSSTIIRFINETVPFHIADLLSVGYVFISTIGSIIAFSLGSVLPADDQND